MRAGYTPPIFDSDVLAVKPPTLALSPIAGIVSANVNELTTSTNRTDGHDHHWVLYQAYLSNFIDLKERHKRALLV
jgi:hypothetical protein